MSQVDQFESVFRAAVKKVYIHANIELKRILLITDLSGEDAKAFESKIKGFLKQPEARWVLLDNDAYSNTEDLLTIVEKENCDLICSYRNLQTKAWQFPYSLGDKLDVLLQKTPVPVLILPHPQAGYAYPHAFECTSTVMAITDHLVSDDNLVNYAAHFTDSSGQLFLAHIEDQAIFDRYTDAISKIPTIDTEDACQRLKKQLLKMPGDYIDSCRSVLASQCPNMQVHAIVQFGHHLSEYQKYIEQEKVDLLLMHAKDDDQLAMHGLAYPLAVELRQIPLLMI